MCYFCVAPSAAEGLPAAGVRVTGGGSGARALDRPPVTTGRLLVSRASGRTHDIRHALPRLWTRCALGRRRSCGQGLSSWPMTRQGVAAGSILYVFLDESGNLDFSGRGTDHFVLSAVYTTDPCRSAAVMQELKYDLIGQGSDDLEFHATNNTPGTRRRVSEAITSLADTIDVHTLWVDKHYAHPTQHDDVTIMSAFGTAMGRWIDRAVSGDHTQIVMVFDSVLTGKKQAAFKAAVKPALKQLDIPFRIAFHPVKSDLNGQIADYFSWAWLRHVESKNPAAMEALGGVKWTQFNLYRKGTRRWW